MMMQTVWPLGTALAVLLGAAAAGVARAETMQCEVPVDIPKDAPPWTMIVQYEPGADELSIALPCSGIREHPVVDTQILTSWHSQRRRASPSLTASTRSTLKRRQAAEVGVVEPIPFGDDPGKVKAFSALYSCR